MAKITQDVRPTNDPSYIGLSREPDHIRPNQSLGTLFEGIGEGLSGVVKTVDNEFQTRIKDELYAGVDKIRGEQGVDAALATDGGLFSNTKGNPTITTGQERTPLVNLNRPPNADAIDGQLKRLTEARDQGQISDLRYQTQLEALSRQVRSRYPGYREEIDQKIKEITGINPANAIRSEISAQLAAQDASRNGAADKYLTYLKQKNEFLPPDFWQKYGTPNAYPEAYIYQHVGRQERDKLDHEVTMRGFTESKARNEDVSTRALEHGTNQVGQLVTNTLASITTQVGGAGNDKLVTKIMDMASKGTKVGPQEIQTITNELNGLTTRVQLLAQQKMYAPGPNGGPSMAALIGDPNKVKAMIDQQIAPIQTLRDAISNQDFGLAAANLRYSTSLQNETGRQLLEGSEVYRRAAAARTQLGDTAFGILIQNNNNLRDITNNLISDGLTKGITDPNHQFSKTIETMKKDPSTKGEAWKTLMTNWSRAASAPDMKPEALKNHLLSVFKENEENGHLLSRFTDKDRVGVYLQMGGPTIAGQVKKLNDPEVTQSYLKWMDTGLSTVFGTQLRGMAKESNNADLWTVRYDPATGFVPELTPNGQEWFKAGIAGKRFGASNFIAPGGNPDWRKMIGAEYSSIDQINKGLQAWTPAMKALGKDPTQSLQQFMNTMEFKIDGSKPSQQGWFDKLKGSLGMTPSKKAPTDPQSLGNQRYQEQKQSSLIDLDQKDISTYAGVNNDVLNPILSSYAEQVASKFNIPITSGFRDPEHNHAVKGAKGSQHMHGNAVDLSLKGMSDREKEAVIAEILSNPQVGGIGYYDNESIHFDMRPNQKAAWGQGRNAASVAQTPPWFQNRVKAWQNS